MAGRRSSPHPGLIAAIGLGIALSYAAPVSGQFIDKHFAPLPAVPDSSAYAPDVQAAILEGYRHLALVESPSDDAHLDPARDAFERALDGEPRAAHALVGLGIYELTKDEQWLVVLESLKKLFNRDHISMAVKAFERALAADDDLHIARYDLALAHRQARGEENYRRAATELELLLQAEPHFPDARLLLALTYRDAGDLKAMERSLAGSSDERAASAGAEAHAFPPAARELLLTYALINSDQAEAGVTAYWRGVDAIATGRDAELFWHDIRPIASGEMDAAFHALAETDRATFLQEFWRGLADQSFVSPDERVVEHYQRLHVVYANYRLDLPERRHYSEIVAYVPAWQTGFDDRGVIYLRHGPPDDTASYSGPEVEQNISWRYDRLEGDPLVFHFVSDEDVGDFKLVRRLEDALISNSTKMTGQTLFNPQCASGGRCDGDDTRIMAADVEGARALYGSRGELNPVYDRVAMNFDAQALEAEEAELARDITVGTQSQSYEPEPPDAPLPYPVYPVAFKEPDGRTSVAFYYALPTSQMSVLRRGGG
ncbi:MAG: GWxTD domain-containing protein, partial [Gemmatimonadota bacterium]